MLRKGTVFFVYCCLWQALYGGEQAGATPYDNKQFAQLADSLRACVGAPDGVVDIMLSYVDPAFPHRFPISFLMRATFVPREWGEVHDVYKNPQTGAIKVLTCRPYQFLGRWSNSVRNFLGNVYDDNAEAYAVMAVALSMSLGAAVDLVSLSNSLSLTDAEPIFKQLQEQHSDIIVLPRVPVWAERSCTMTPEAENLIQYLNQIEGYERSQLPLTLVAPAIVLCGAYVYISLGNWLREKLSRYEILVGDLNSRTIESSLVTNRAGGSLNFGESDHEIRLDNTLFKKDKATGVFKVELPCILPKKLDIYAYCSDHNDVPDNRNIEIYKHMQKYGLRKGIRLRIDSLGLMTLDSISVQDDISTIACDMSIPLPVHATQKNTKAYIKAANPTVARLHIGDESVIVDFQAEAILPQVQKNIRKIINAGSVTAQEGDRQDQHMLEKLQSFCEVRVPEKPKSNIMRTILAGGATMLAGYVWYKHRQH